MAYGNFYSGPSLVMVRWTDSVPEWKQIGMLCLTSNAPVRSSPTSTPKTTNRWTDGLDERTIIKGIFFYFKTLHIQTTCQKCIQTHLAIYRNVIGDWAPSKSRACTAVQSCSKHLKHSFQTTHRRQEVGI